MTYRIRYRQAGNQSDAEALIEANSPTEALVKFRCTRKFHPYPSESRDRITSVCAVDHPDISPG